MHCNHPVEGADLMAAGRNLVEVADHNLAVVPARSLAGVAGHNPVVVLARSLAAEFAVHSPDAVHNVAVEEAAARTLVVAAAVEGIAADHS